MLDRVLYTVREAAEALGWRPTRVKRLLTIGAMPGLRYGRQWYVNVRALHAWVDALTEHDLQTRSARTAHRLSQETTVMGRAAAKTALAALARGVSGGTLGLGGAASDKGHYVNHPANAAGMQGKAPYPRTPPSDKT